MKILAIDPGYGRCGVAIIERPGRPGENNKETLVFSDCVETSALDNFAERLAVVADVCTRLIKEHSPEALAIEKLFFSSNQKTAMRVAEVRGALIETATRLNVPVFEYSPGEVKSATTGSGRADKRAVATMVRALVKIDKEIQHDDEYDAIAIGLTHLARVRK
jgi:crossover junction endodeoxyribonuclease RuvC